MQSVKLPYIRLIEIGTNFQPIFLLLIRIVWGTFLMIGGWGKLHNISEMASYFYSLSIPFSEAMVYAVGSIEFVGGICLLIGFASRLVAIPVAVVMLFALLLGHQEAMMELFSKPEGILVQSPFTYLLVCLIIFAFGPGSVSIDWLLEKLLRS